MVKNMASHILQFVAISFAINVYVITAENVSSLTQVCIAKKYSRSSYWEVSLGAKSFPELTKESELFVDKSLLLKKIFSPDAPKAILIIAPHKWGKTINLDMITFFAHTEFYDNGKERQKKQTSAYKYFTKGIRPKYSYFSFNKPPLISKDSDIIKEHLKRYLVLKVDLSETTVKDQYDAISFEKFHLSFRNAIRQTLADNTFIKNVVKEQIPKNDTHGREEVEKCNSMLEYWENVEYSTTDLTKSIHVLCEMIRYKSHAKDYKYTLEKKEILLIIDQYDKPFNDIIIYLKGNSKDQEAKRIRKFMHDFFKQTIHVNKYYNRTIITGISRIEDIINSSNSGCSDCNSYDKRNCKIVEMNYQDSLFPFYGFTRREVKKLFNCTGLMNHYEEVKNTYKGYRSKTHSKHLLYNPLNIMLFIDSKMVVEQKQTESSNESTDESTNESTEE